MSKRRIQKELQTLEAFDESLRQEVAVSSEFDLPLTVLSMNMSDGWDGGSTRRALDSLRTADLAAQVGETELLVALPNTTAEDARVVEERLRAAVPEAVVGVSAYAPDDSVEALVGRARDALQEATEDPEKSEETRLTNAHRCA